MVQEDGLQAIWQSPAAEYVAWFGNYDGRTIGRLLAEMSDYRPLGAVLPDISAELAAYHPDDYDAPALELAVPNATRSPVTAMWLVRVAGRFGWTVREAFDRLNRFRSLGVNLEPSRDQCPDAIVHWADVIVLSEYLDGADPGLRGPVSAVRIGLAAEAVREPPADTRARLLRYAEMFRLQPEDLP